MKDVLLSIAQAVRQSVLPLIGTPEAGEVVGRGADGNYSYRIDRVAEDAAFAEIKRLGLSYNILSEESSFQDNGSKETLVLDPVDGSRNAIIGLPMYSVSIAIGSGSLSRVREGLVLDIASGRAYYAEKDHGATLDERPLKVRSYDEKRSVFLLNLGMNSSSTVFDIGRKSPIVRSYGSAALEISMIAEGKADLFVSRAIDNSHAMRIVDIAAASLILREAGGQLYDATGNLLDMNFDINDRKNIFAIGDTSLRRLVL